MNSSQQNQQPIHQTPDRQATTGTDLNSWFLKNKKTILPGGAGLIVLLLVLFAFRFVLNYDFGSKSRAQAADSTVSTRPGGTGAARYASSENSTMETLTQNAVVGFMNEWTRMQNEKRLAGYAQCYATAFKGIKRTKSGNTFTYNQRSWLADRTKMYAGARGLNISLSNIQVMLHGTMAIVYFTQNYYSTDYQDTGNKEMELRLGRDGQILIYREEMLNSDAHQAEHR